MTATAGIRPGLPDPRETGEPPVCAHCPVRRAGEPARRRRLPRFDALILEAVATGASSLQIAGRLHLSRQAVDYHVKGMQRRLHAANRVELVARAYASGVLEAGSWPPRVPAAFLAED